MIFFSFTAKAESKILSIGNPNAKVIVKVFSSLTCPHCADFHTEIYNKLKKDYNTLLLFLIIQVLVGIFAVVKSVPISLGVIHQLCAVLLLLSAINLRFNLFLSQK